MGTTTAGALARGHPHEPVPARVTRLLWVIRHLSPTASGPEPWTRSWAKDHLLAPGAPLRTLLEADRISSLVLWGPPGTGKTTLARLVAHTTSMAFVPMSAVNAGVKDVRGVIETARRRRAETGRGLSLIHI